ncbi:MAG: TRAP transporter small permease [Oscillospiraceae bacterium]|nr:TRAP transporter small permease [Oscillospiraceae bacterium]
MKILTKSIGALAIAVNAISYICFTAIMLLIVTDVMLRYLLNSPILGSLEIVEQLMLCGVISSFAYAQMKGTHVHVTMLIGIFPRKIGLAVFALGELLSAGIGALLCNALIKQTGMAMDYKYTTVILKISTVPSYVIVSIAAGVLSLTLFLSAIKGFASLFNKEYEAEITADWL